jgi:hypothetical protein
MLIPPWCSKVEVCLSCNPRGVFVGSLDTPQHRLSAAGSSVSQEDSNSYCIDRNNDALVQETHILAPES